MVSSIRKRTLDAAVNLIGVEGIRALTHGRVDAAASLPPGSTSNYFRTRAALVSGVIEWIATQERGDGGLPEILTRDDFVEVLSRMIAIQSGPLAARTRARYALFLEADDEAALPLREQRKGMEAWVRGILLKIGGEAAAARTTFVMAAADGLLFHRVTVDPEAPIEPVVTSAVDAALAAPTR